MEEKNPQFSFEHQPHERRAHVPHEALVDAKQKARRGQRSVEYIFLTIALLTVAFNLPIVLIVWLNGLYTNNGINFESIAFPAAALIVALPILMVFLMDIERAEQKNPQLKLSPYKKYSAMLVKVIAFITCFFTLIGLVFGIFIYASSSQSSHWLPRLITDSLIILAVAGGLLYLAYAAMDDHRKP